VSGNVLQVVVAAVFDAEGRLLITQRGKQAHQGGLWELPGGKQDADESVCEALRRELLEEVGIHITTSNPVIQITHHYPDLTVCLHLWRVTECAGRATAREGQPLRWIALSELPNYPFPKANRALFQALSLPDAYLITPDLENNDINAFLKALERSLAAGIKLVQLRVKSLVGAEYEALAQQVVALCHRCGVKVLLNAHPDSLARVSADGVHLSQSLAAEFSERPVAAESLLAVSCHDEASLQQAELMEADFAVLSPVQQTTSHPEAKPLGWPEFQRWVTAANVPVYALGGLGQEDILMAQQHAAQGVAAISALWNGEINE